MPKTFTFREHQQFTEDEISALKDLEITLQGNPDSGIPKYLGIDYENASYYVGASWLTKDNAVVVLPKNIDTENNEITTDLIEMYLTALKFAPSAEYFSKYYDIDYTQRAIKCDALADQLTPLLIIHFISTVERILKKGLKKCYVMQEENLQSKVRGKIMMQKNLEKNVFTKRIDRIFCRFQEYTVDHPENRLLKKALAFSLHYLNNWNGLDEHKSLRSFKAKTKSMISAFYLVSDKIETYEIKNLKRNKIFKEYSEGIRLAKMILQHFDFSISKTHSSKKTVPPFWIDMSRLYEVYVYAKLEEAYPRQIGFQVSGYQGTAIDFIYKTKTEGVILDAKYKTRYQNSNQNIIDDIRQLSGYARDEKILKQFEPLVRDTVIPCIIIYPIIQEGDDPISFPDDINDLLKDDYKIRGFKGFYKVSVEIPKLSKK